MSKCRRQSPIQEKNEQVTQKSFILVMSSSLYAAGTAYIRSGAFSIAGE